MSAKQLKDMGMEKASHIASGFNGWKEAGFEVVDYQTWKAAQA